MAPPAPHIDLSSERGDAVVYAVGDVHGMDALLDVALAEIEADAAARARSALVVFLGDIVNRGPGARAALDRVIAGPRRPGDRFVCIAGNHERNLVAALDADAAFPRFLRKGGSQTLASYGCPLASASADALRALMPASHQRFVRDLPLTCRIDDLLFVHAGVEPGKPLAEQTAKCLTTIREPFFERPHGLPFTIVHGHTPTHGAPVIAPGRICVDTGAVMTGILTTAVFDRGAPPRFLAAVRGAKRHVRAEASLSG